MKIQTLTYRVSTKYQHVHGMTVRGIVQVKVEGRTRTFTILSRPNRMNDLVIEEVSKRLVRIRVQPRVLYDCVYDTISDARLSILLYLSEKYE